MKRVIGALLLAVVMAASAEASFFDFNQITIDNTAGGIALTASKITPFLSYVQCRVRTAEISYAYAGPAKVTVSSSVGTLAEPGEFINITSVEMAQNFRAIRTGSTSGQLDCHYVYTQAP
jgi:hypothetical protein